jgi:hypothetical protein
MNGVQQVALEKAVRLLDSLKLDYAIVVSDDFSIIKGDIKVTTKGYPRSATAPHGTYSALFKRHGVNEMKIGDVVVVPCGELDPVIVKRTSSAYCYHLWGSKSSMAAIEGDTVEIMRVDNGT